MRHEKKYLLEEISDKVSGANACLFASYQKMDPNTASQFRLQLAKVGGGFTVVRKRILMKAAAEMGIHLKKEMLQGHIGVVYSKEDPIQTTKTVFQFSKENEEMLNVLGGHFEGKLYSAQDVKTLSQLPPKDEMRASLLGLFEAPMAQTLSVMEALLTSLLHCIENKSEKEKN